APPRGASRAAAGRRRPPARRGACGPPRTRPPASPRSRPPRAQAPPPPAHLTKRGGVRVAESAQANRPAVLAAAPQHPFYAGLFRHAAGPGVSLVHPGRGRLVDPRPLSKDDQRRLLRARLEKHLLA